MFHYKTEHNTIQYLNKITVCNLIIAQGYIAIIVQQHLFILI